MLRARAVTVLEYTHTISVHTKTNIPRILRARKFHLARTFACVCVDCTEVLEIISLNVSTCICVCVELSGFFLYYRKQDTHIITRALLCGVPSRDERCEKTFNRWNSAGFRICVA